MSNHAEEERAGFLTLILMWLSVFYISLSWCHGLGCSLVIVALPGHTQFLLTVTKTSLDLFAWCHVGKRYSSFLPVCQ